MSLNELTIAKARDRLRAREITATELTDACLSAAEGAGALNAFVHHTPEIARQQAAAADERLASGDAPAMCGIPVGIKDLFCTKGVPSQAASRILEGFRPEYESTVTQNLFDAGADRSERPQRVVKVEGDGLDGEIHPAILPLPARAFIPAAAPSPACRPAVPAPA